MVDPVFRDQFEIGKSTPRYASLLSSLPEVFIGPFENLTRLVLFLCAEMATSFAEAEGGCVGVLPPWRLPGSMLSKWSIPPAVKDRVGLTEGNIINY